MSADYLLGMEPAEIDRLRRQHETWRVETERVWAIAGFRAGQTIVDLGCGPGFTSLGLAELVGSTGRVVAVDASVVATEALRAAARRDGRANIEILSQDVCALDLAPWRADGVFARWLFSFLPDPTAVVRRLAAGLPSRATVAVMDYWNYLAIRSEPDAEVFRTVFRAVHASFADAGGSLDVAGTLPAAFEDAGIRVTAIEPVTRVGRPGEPVWRWLEDFLGLYLPSLVEQGVLAEHDVQDYWRWWGSMAARREAFVFGPPMLALVGVKA